MKKTVISTISGILISLLGVALIACLHACSHSTERNRPASTNFLLLEDVRTKPEVILEFLDDPEVYRVMHALLDKDAAHSGKYILRTTACALADESYLPFIYSEPGPFFKPIVIGGEGLKYLRADNQDSLHIIHQLHTRTDKRWKTEHFPTIGENSLLAKKYETAEGFDYEKFSADGYHGFIQYCQPIFDRDSMQCAVVSFGYTGIIYYSSTHLFQKKNSQWHEVGSYSNWTSG